MGQRGTQYLVVEGTKFFPPAWQLFSLIKVCLDPVVGVVCVMDQQRLSSGPELDSLGIPGMVAWGVWGCGWWTWSFILLGWFLYSWGFGSLRGWCGNLWSFMELQFIPQEICFFLHGWGVMDLSLAGPNSEASTIPSPSSHISGAMHLWRSYAALHSTLGGIPNLSIPHWRAYPHGIVHSCCQGPSTIQMLPLG